MFPLYDPLPEAPRAIGLHMRILAGRGLTGYKAVDRIDLCWYNLTVVEVRDKGVLVMKKHVNVEVKKEVPVTRAPAVTGVETVSPITRVEREMLTTLHEMERWFEDALHRPFLGFHRFPLVNLLGERRMGDFVPAIDMFEEGNDLVIRAELAGIKREDIKLELSGSTLTLSGEKRGEEKVERKDYYRVEQSYGSFSRTLDLPEGVDPDGIKATYKDGLLEIRIRRTAATRTTKTVPIG
jgi:HSP20 family protein